MLTRTENNTCQHCFDLFLREKLMEKCNKCGQPPKDGDFAVLEVEHLTIFKGKETRNNAFRSSCFKLCETCYSEFVLFPLGKCLQ